MPQIFPVPDRQTEDRMRRALDALQSVRRIQDRIGSGDPRFAEVRENVVAAKYDDATRILGCLLREAGVRDEETVMDLSTFMTAGGVPNPVDRIASIVGPTVV